MSEDHKTKIGYYKRDIILISSVLIIALIHKMCLGIFFYIGGLKGNPFYGMMVIPLEFVLFCLFVALLIIALVNLIRVVIKIYKAKKVEWLRVFLCLVPFFIGGVLCVSEKPGAIYFLRGYEKWVQNEVDIAYIQKWLISLDIIYSDRRYHEAKDFPEELPTAITRLKPYHMYFSKFDAENRSVEFEWGCALDHWGIRIGLPGMETPKEGYIKISEEGNWGEYRRPIQPGVYIFDRD